MSWKIRKVGSLTLASCEAGAFSIGLSNNYIGEWFLHCDALFILSKPLTCRDLDAAKREALGIVHGRLSEALEAVKEGMS